MLSQQYLDILIVAEGSLVHDTVHALEYLCNKDSEKSGASLNAITQLLKLLSTSGPSTRQHMDADLGYA